MGEKEPKEKKKISVVGILIWIIGGIFILFLLLIPAITKYCNRPKESTELTVKTMEPTPNQSPTDETVKSTDEVVDEEGEESKVLYPKPANRSQELVNYVAQPSFELTCESGTSCYKLHLYGHYETNLGLEDTDVTIQVIVKDGEKTLIVDMSTITKLDNIYDYDTTVCIDIDVDEVIESFVDIEKENSKTIKEERYQDGEFYKNGKWKKATPEEVEDVNDLCGFLVSTVLINVKREMGDGDECCDSVWN